MNEVCFMKNNKFFLLAALPMLVASLLVGCSSNNKNDESNIPDVPKPIEIGDTVKEWTSESDLETAPLDVKDANEGTVNITDKLGYTDVYSLECNITGDYITSEVIQTPYFTDEDAKNGDIISLYFYLFQVNFLDSPGHLFCATSILFWDIDIHLSKKVTILFSNDCILIEF